jgi:hypothetical protein
MIAGRMLGPGGKPTLLLGLSRENMDKLLADQPIVLNGGPLGVGDITVLLIGGETEQTMSDQLRELGMITPQTRVETEWPEGANPAAATQP